MRIPQLRIVIYLLLLMALTYGYSYWLLTDQAHFIFGPIGSTTFGLPLLIVVPVVILAGVITLIRAKKPIIKMMSMSLIVVLLLISYLFVFLTQQEVHYTVIENETGYPSILIKESPSWLSTELSIYSDIPWIGWSLEETGLSTSTKHLPFKDGDYTIVWLNPNQVEITWLFDNDENTDQSVIITIDGKVSTE